MPLIPGKITIEINVNLGRLIIEHVDTNPETLIEILQAVRQVEERQVAIMSIVDDIKKQQADTKASIQGVSGDIASLVAQIQALKDQIAAGSPATLEDLEAILTGASEIAASVKAVDDSVPGNPTV